MIPDTRGRRTAALGALSKAASGAVALVAGLVLAGWVLDIPTLKSVLPGAVTMKANTAVAFIAAAVALWLLAAEPRDRRVRRVAHVFALGVAAVGLLTLCEYVFGWEFGLDQLLFREPPGAPGTFSPGRMAPTTALNFLLLGTALVVLDARPPHGRRLAEGLALTAALIAVLALIGYAYSVPALYGIAHYTSMALHTAVLFLLLCAGVLTSRRDGWLMAIVASEGAGGVIARRLLPVVIGIPLLLGWIRLQGQRAGLYSTEFGASVMVLVTVVLVSVAIFWSAAALNRMDAERKRAGDALRQSEERYRLLFHAGPVPAWVYDLKTLKFVAVNEAAVRKYGYERDEFLGMTIADLRPPEDVPALLEAVSQLAPGRVGGGTWRHRKKDGTLLEVEITSHALMFAGRPADLVLAQDITERKRVEEALRAGEEYARLVVDAAYDAFVAIDQEGVITGWNRQAESVFGWSSEEAIGRSLAETIIPEQYRDAHRRGLKHFLATGEGPVLNRVIDITAVRRSGAEFPVELTISPLRFGGRHIFTAFVRDVTERKQAEETLKRYAAELEAANSELDAFSYSVSHDLRAPLRAIDGFSRILLEDHRGALDAEGERLLGVVRTSTQRMGQLIDDLLTFSRISRKSLEAGPVDMRALVQAVAEDLRSGAAPHPADIVVGPLPPACGDGALLRQVWTNLVGNALKFSRTRPRPRVEVGSLDGTGETVFFVRDNGVGFDMEYAGKLFGVFQRLHRAEEFEGTGVGLAIVQRIVHRHGGRVWAEAEPDRGATFYFTLPVPEA